MGRGGSRKRWNVYRSKIQRGGRRESRKEKLQKGIQGGGGLIKDNDGKRRIKEEGRESKKEEEDQGRRKRIKEGRSTKKDLKRRRINK